MDKVNKLQEYPTLTDHIDHQLLSKDVETFIKQAEKSMIENIGPGKIILPFDDLINLERSDIDIKSNFACMICKNVPLAPATQCDECEMLYCSTNLCLNGVTECVNDKCPKQKKFATSRISRIIRNVMSYFEFNHTENGEVVKYEKKCTILMDEYKSTLEYKCSKCE